MVLFSKSIKVFPALSGRVGWKHRMSPAIFGFLAVSAANATRTGFLELFSTALLMPDEPINILG